jgi:hypothetical protein
MLLVVAQKLVVQLQQLLHQSLLLEALQGNWTRWWAEDLPQQREEALLRSWGKIGKLQRRKGMHQQVLHLPLQHLQQVHLSQKPLLHRQLQWRLQ